MPNRGEKTARPIREGRLLDLVADAIVANHLRLVSGSSSRELAGKEFGVPFLYTFLDYLRIVLPGSPQMLIAPVGGQTALSTETGNVVALRTTGAPDNRTRFDSVVLLSEDDSTLLSGRGLLSEFLGCVKKTADLRGPSVQRDLSSMLACGLSTILEQAQAEEPLVDHADDAAAEIDVPGVIREVDQIVGHTHRHLAETLNSSDLAYDLVLRCWTVEGASYRVLPYRESEDRRIETAGEPIDLDGDSAYSRWSGPVTMAFRTGFMQIGKTTNDDELLLCVPCHFGGVPWLVVCRRIPRFDHGDWWAYTTYRDLIPRLNDAVRMAGWRSLFSEMRRLFFSSTQDFKSDPRRFQENIQIAWASLARVYPVSPPRLVEVLEGGDERETLIPFAGLLWRVIFSEARNPFFLALLPAEGSAVGRWSRINTLELQQVFLAPVRSRLLSAQASLNTELAESVYAIGHPLKNRLGRIGSRVGTMLNDLKAGRFDPEVFKGYCHHISLHNTKAASTAETMDLMADLIRHEGDLSKLEERFLDPSPYSVGQTFREIVSDFEAAESQLKISKSDLAVLDDVLIQPTIPTRATPCRLFDTFYDDVFLELIINVGRYCPLGDRTVRVRFESVEYSADDRQVVLPCITVTNKTSESRFERLSLRLGCWTPWRTDRGGPKGGLRLIANQLQLTGMGDLLARPFGHDGSSWFSVAVHFKGSHSERPTA